MRLSNGFVIDKEKTFGELKFTAVRDVFLQNEDGTPSTQLKKRIYDLKCSLHGGIIPVSVPPEVPLREFPYNAVVELVNPVADTVSRKTYTGADVDWYVKAENIVLKNNGKSGLCNVKPKLRILMREGIYNDKLNDKFKLIDMKFDTDIEGYTLPEIDNSSNNLNSDMGYVRTDDWKSFAFRVYIESNSEISYTCVFRTPKEYADDENLVIGNDDSHASRRWDGEKEVTYDNGGYRIYINRQ